MENETLTFGGFPITFELKDSELLIHCKDVTGTLSQVEGFLNENGWKRHYFGPCKIRKWRQNQIKIDCLQDSNSNFKKLYELAKQFKNELKK